MVARNHQWDAGVRGCKGINSAYNTIQGFGMLNYIFILYSRFRMYELPNDVDQLAPAIRSMLAHLESHHHTLRQVTKSLENTISYITENYTTMLNGVGLDSRRTMCLRTSWS